MQILTRGTRVSGPGGEQVWAGPGPSAIPAALKALADSYTVTMSRPTTTLRIWLDTADWRLHHKGLALAATAGADSDEYTLELHDPDGGVLTVGPDTLGWPRLLAGLPDPLRSVLDPVLGVRALTPVVQVSGTAATGNLLDAEGKTVVRLVHQRPATLSGGGGRLPGRLLVIPVRGYAGDAARAARVLAEEGLWRADRSGYPAALQAAGFDPDASPPPAIEAGMPADVAVARVLLSFLDELEATHDGTVMDIDIEFLHEFRVAVRRSRSAVKLLGDVLPPAVAEWGAPQLKWLGDLTTPMRDLDVHLLEVPTMTGQLTSGSPEDLDPLTAHLARLRVGERRLLVRGLRSARFERFRTQWRAMLDAVADPPEPDDANERPGARLTAAELGIERLGRADRRVLRPGAKITPSSPAEDLHDLRKRCKELRYLLEIFSPLLDPSDAGSAVKELKALQDVLGTFQDSEVQREAIYALADDLIERGGTSARTIMAMGEIAARLFADQQSSRAAFATKFARFGQPSVQRRMTRIRPSHPGPGDPTADDPTTGEDPTAGDDLTASAP
jgi:CHAD domain-containing protein